MIPDDALRLAQYTVEAFERGLAVQANALPLARALLAAHAEEQNVAEECARIAESQDDARSDLGGMQAAQAIRSRFGLTAKETK